MLEVLARRRELTHAVLKFLAWMREVNAGVLEVLAWMRKLLNRNIQTPCGDRTKA
ncbi:hypothetical protein J32TS6_10600 [Virgibacillus pantothenticus]|nr:hypothetical protein J32TS6_10600 [Virgibacillus pantothenticus]